MKNEIIEKLLLAYLSEDKKNPEDNIYSDAIGKYVIIRSYNEGINVGYLEKADRSGCVLKDARRIFMVISKDINLSWYEGVAVSGLGDESKISGKVDKKYIVERYSITLVSKDAEKQILEFKPNETTC